jgi:hypothetical protein
VAGKKSKGSLACQKLLGYTLKIARWTLMGYTLKLQRVHAIDQNSKKKLLYCLTYAAYNIMSHLQGKHLPRHSPVG